MKRRDFVKSTIGMLPAAHAGVMAAAQTRRGGSLPASMKVGVQQWPGQRGPDAYSDGKLAILAALGVNHVCKTLPVRIDDSWTAASMIRLRERTEKFGIYIEQILCPLSDTFRNIVMGRSPERDREIDTVCELIRSVARAKIPLLQYYLNVLVGVPRTGSKPGRGGSLGGAFVYEEARQEPPLTDAGPVTEEQYFERAAYFLQRVVPVAEEYNVRMGCHPQDPAMPYGKPFRGVYRALTTPQNLQRYLDLVPSRHHCLHLCQGTVAEMLEKPGEQIYDVIRGFGKQGKIISVHFRNITGKRANFRETFIDEGDVDMLKACRAYKEVGFAGMLMPDHVPEIPSEPAEFRGYQGFAYTIGYIKGLIAAANAEA